MNKQDDTLLYNRILELANRAYKNNIYSFTDFLGLSQQDVFYKVIKDAKFPPIHYELFGGSSNCERQVVRFGSEEDLGYAVDFPIVCIKIESLYKNATLYSHRDYLGSLMGLGIERKKFGDIIVDQKDAYVFCLDTTGDYVLENLSSVGHNSVKCSLSKLPDSYAQEALTRIIIQCASPRIDAIISKVYNLSRKDAIPLFTEKRVYVNGRIVENKKLHLCISALKKAKDDKKEKPKATVKLEWIFGKIAMLIQVMTELFFM
mgnify:CR=1 FL=1